MFQSSVTTLKWTAVLSLAAWFTAALYGQQAVLTWHNDNARSGQNLQEATLTPANVNASTFGKLFVLPVDGQVLAQPLYVPSVAIPGRGTLNVVLVVTEHDSAYAFDADTGTPLWQMSLLGANESTSDDRGCDEVVPEIGVTATPVIDPHSGPNGSMYVVAMSEDASGNYHQRLHALDLTTGAEEFGGPTEIQATYPGSGAEGSGGTLTFDPSLHKERAALLLLNGIVYTTWSSHCDSGPYTSWVMGYDEATLSQVNVLNLAPNGLGGGIWQSGAGPAADSNGNVYLSTGNGTFDITLDSSGLPATADYGNAFVKISTAGGNLAVADYFTMSGTTSETDEDVDLGSGGMMLLPPVSDAEGTTPALGVGAGKDQTIYLVDLNNLGQFHPGMDMVYQELPSAVNPVFSSPAWFNNTLYYGSSSSYLVAFPFANGTLNPAPIAQAATWFPYPGATPSISANGTSNAIVWAVERSAPAVLHAYDANDLTELYNSAQAPDGRDQFGDGVGFPVPTVVNGKVYVGTTNGVGVFGLLPPPAQGLNSTLSCQISNATSAQVTFTIQDISSGVSSIIVADSTNANVSIPSFALGTTDPVYVAADPIDSSQFSKVDLELTNAAGGAASCGSTFGGPTGWTGIGGGFKGKIVTVTNTDGRLQEFVRGNDNALWTTAQKSPDGGWTSWQSLGGVITSDPTVAANIDGCLEAFAIGTDGALWHIRQTSANGSWAGWESLGGFIISDPAVGANQDGRLEVFVVGGDQALWHIWQTSAGGSWSDWASLGGDITSNPTVVRNADGRLEAFVLGDQQGLLHIAQTAANSVWGAWSSLGGSLAGDPAPVVNQDGRLEVFVRGSDNQLWHIWQTVAGNSWASFSTLGGVLTSNPGVGMNADGRLEAFVRGADNALWHIAQTEVNSTWGDWGTLGGILANGSTVGLNQDGRLETFVEGSDTSLWFIEQVAPGFWN